MNVPLYFYKKKELWNSNLYFFPFLFPYTLFLSKQIQSPQVKTDLVWILKKKTKSLIPLKSVQNPNFRPDCDICTKKNMKIMSFA